MATRSELMASGMPWLQAQMLGVAVGTALSAAGTTQATGTTISAGFSEFSTVASGAGATLPTAGAQPMYGVLNTGANVLTVYCAVGEVMNGTTNGSVQIAPGRSALFLPHNNRWIGLV